VLFWAGLVLGARAAQAEQYDLQVVLEPGVSTLHESGVSNWGPLGGGVSAGFSLNDRLSLIALYDRSQYVDRDPSLSAQAIGAGGKFSLDLSVVTPFLELGYANVYLKAANGGRYGPHWDPFLGAGADVRFTRWLFGGLVFRYFGVGGTDLLTDPAYATINARIGFVLGAPGPRPAPTTTNEILNGPFIGPGTLQ
jgi:hypothetical protein